MGSKGPKHGKVTVGGKAAARNGWDTRPQRSAVLAAIVAEQTRPAIERVPERGVRGRKDTRRWCKGKPGREHVLQIVFRPWYGRSCHPLEQGSWLDFGKKRWHCEHREVCSACGKIMREGWQLRADECPDFRAPAQKRAPSADD